MKYLRSFESKMHNTHLVCWDEMSGSVDHQPLGRIMNQRRNNKDKPIKMIVFADWLTDIFRMHGLWDHFP